MRNVKNIASLLVDGVKTVGCSFNPGGKIYTYKTTEDFAIDDKAIVLTPENNYQMVNIEQIHPVPRLEDHISYKWIVQKLDTTMYDNLVAREQELIDKLLQLQQTAIVANARTQLAESLGISVEEVNSIVAQINAPERVRL